VRLIIVAVSGNCQIASAHWKKNGNQTIIFCFQVLLLLLFSSYF